MELKKILEEACVKVAQFQGLLLYLGQQKDLPEAWEKIRVQRTAAIESCCEAKKCIVKFQTSTAEEINDQLDNLFFCVEWLLKEMTMCEILADKIRTVNNFPNLRQLEHCLIETDIGHVKILLGGIHSSKIRVSIMDW